MQKKEMLYIKQNLIIVWFCHQKAWSRFIWVFNNNFSKNEIHKLNIQKSTKFLPKISITDLFQTNHFLKHENKLTFSFRFRMNYKFCSLGADIFCCLWNLLVFWFLQSFLLNIWKANFAFQFLLSFFKYEINDISLKSLKSINYCNNIKFFTINFGENSIFNTTEEKTFKHSQHWNNGWWMLIKRYENDP